MRDSTCPADISEIFAAVVVMMLFNNVDQTLCGNARPGKRRGQSSGETRIAVDGPEYGLEMLQVKHNVE